MQYGELFLRGKSNSSFEVVTFPWINVSGYNFNIMNTLHFMNLHTTQTNVGKNLQYLSNNNLKAAC